MLHKILALVIWFFLAIYNAIATVTGSSFKRSYMLTGVIEQGILGGFSGKVGPVVGGNWKGIDYMRGYVVPANPNTAGQQTQRTKFGMIVGHGKQLLTNLLQVYWDPFAVKMSGFNRFIQYNIDNMVGSTVVPDIAFQVALGSLEAVPITSAIINSSDIDIVWDEAILSNGLLTDSVMVVYWNAVLNDWQYFNPSKTRDDEAATISPDTAVTDSDLIWIFATRGTGSEFIVSDSNQESVIN